MRQNRRREGLSQGRKLINDPVWAATIYLTSITYFLQHEGSISYVDNHIHHICAKKTGEDNTAACCRAWSRLDVRSLAGRSNHIRIVLRQILRIYSNDSREAL